MGIRWRRLLFAQKSIRMGTAAEGLANREFEPRRPGDVPLTHIPCFPFKETSCCLSTILDVRAKQARPVSGSSEGGFAPETASGDPLHQFEVHPAAGEPGAEAAHAPPGKLLGQRAPGKRAHEGRTGGRTAGMDVFHGSRGLR